MKTVSICVLLLVVRIACFSQYNNPMGYYLPSELRTVDSAYMKVTYCLMSVKDPKNPSESTYEDLQTLQIGSQVSKFFSQYLIEHYKKIAQDVQKGARVLERNPYRGSYAYEVFRNYPQVDQTTVDVLGDIWGKTCYLYQEDSPHIVWQWDMKQTDTVLGYPCVKATASFRGRDYVAWFTLGIPVPLGPWKFWGLPGLVLKIFDTQNHYAWECVGIERLKQKEPIEFRELKFTKLNRIDLDKLYRRYHRDRAAYINSMGGRVMVANPNGTSREETHSEELPYNPIELE